MSDQGKANYEAFAAEHARLVGGHGPAAYEDLPPGEQRSWDAGADAVALVVGGNEDAAADEVRADRDRYRDALQRLADEDAQVLGEGLGGGDTEELHVRVNLARQVLGLEVCGCTECMVSLGLEPDIEADL